MAAHVELGQVAEQLAELITAAGVPAYVDPRDLELPCAWVTPGAIGSDVLDGSTLAVTWELYLIAPAGLSTVGALDELGRMLHAVQPIVQAVDATPVSLTLQNQSADPLPALRISLPTDVTPEEG